MARDLTLTADATLPAINPNDPASLLSVPRWTDTLMRAVSRTTDGHPIWERSPKIPATSMPSGPQRVAIERRCGELEAMTQPGPEDVAARSVGGLLAFYATGKTDKTTASVKLRGYMLAVEDLPAWAVTEAVRRWFRGGCGHANYEFAPPPAKLRQVAEDVASLARGQLIIMRRILAAEATEPPKPVDRALVERLRAEFEASIAATVRDASMARAKTAPE